MFSSSSAVFTVSSLAIRPSADVFSSCYGVWIFNISVRSHFIFTVYGTLLLITRSSSAIANRSRVRWCSQFQT